MTHYRKSFCGVEAGLILHWELLPCPVRFVSTLYFVLKLSSLVLFFCLCLYLLLVAGVWVWHLLHGIPHNVETNIEVLGLVGDMECVCAYLCFFFLAWLICMLLAGSCPNRGCHLIKSIICWLNLLELRRKRSVHTFTQSAYFSSVSNSLPPMKYTHKKKILCPAIRDPVATAYSWNGQCGRTTSRNDAVFFFLLRTNNGAHFLKLCWFSLVFWAVILKFRVAAAAFMVSLAADKILPCYHHIIVSRRPRLRLESSNLMFARSISIRYNYN